MTGCFDAGNKGIIKMNSYIRNIKNEIVRSNSYKNHFTHPVFLSVVTLDVCLMCLFIDSHGDVVIALYQL